MKTAKASPCAALRPALLIQKFHFLTFCCFLKFFFDTQPVHTKFAPNHGRALYKKIEFCLRAELPQNVALMIKFIGGCLGAGKPISWGWVRRKNNRGSMTTTVDLIITGWSTALGPCVWSSPPGLTPLVRGFPGGKCLKGASPRPYGSSVTLRRAPARTPRCGFDFCLFFSDAAP